MLSADPGMRLAPLLLYSEGVALDSQLCNSTTCILTRPVSGTTRYRAGYSHTARLRSRPEGAQEGHGPPRVVSLVRTGAAQACHLSLNFWKKRPGRSTAHITCGAAGKLTPPEVPAGQVAHAASQVILLTQREEPDWAQELQRDAAALPLQLDALQLAHGLPQKGVDVQQLQSLIDRV